MAGQGRVEIDDADTASRGNLGGGVDGANSERCRRATTVPARNSRDRRSRRLGQTAGWCGQSSGSPLVVLEQASQPPAAGHMMRPHLLGVSRQLFLDAKRPIAQPLTRLVPSAITRAAILVPFAWGYPFWSLAHREVRSETVRLHLVT